MNEQELIQKLQLGDEPAFQWLVENYRNRVFHTILNIVQDTADAEDAAQEVFMQLFESIGRFKGESALSTWIYRIAVSKALDKLRRRKTRLRFSKWLPWWMPEENKSNTSDFYHPGIILDKKEKAAILFKAINTLPEKQRLAFTLVKVQGMNYREVSVIMSQSIKAIESLISRARQNLQLQLESIYYHSLK